MKNIKTLYRPVNGVELDLISGLRWESFPPRLPDQPIFYPVLNYQYAKEINDKWNIPFYGEGYIVEFDIDEEYIDKFEIQNVGGEVHNELWIPTEELENFNSHIIGKIRLI